AEPNNSSRVIPHFPQKRAMKIDEFFTNPKSLYRCLSAHILHKTPSEMRSNDNNSSHLLERTSSSVKLNRSVKANCLTSCSKSRHKHYWYER
ncbi:MAG: hypothetical protein ACOYY5_18725, partial [Pseudomonadota bacterium]